MIDTIPYEVALQSYIKTRTLNLMLNLKLQHLERRIDADKKRIEIAYEQEEKRKQMKKQSVKKIHDILMLFDTRMY